MLSRRSGALLALVLLVVPAAAGCLGSLSPPENKAPIASFTVSALLVDVGEAVVLNAANSTDRDGKIVRYSWDFGDGQVGSGVRVEHAYEEAGTFDVQLVVTDDDGDLDSHPSTVKVNAFPKALGFVPSTTIKIDEVVTFDGSKSADPDGQIADYRWDFGDGTDGTGATPQHAYDRVGTYDVTLVVVDDHGATTTSSFAVEVELRSFRVDWEELVETFDTFSGTLDQNQSDNRTFDLTSDNLTVVTFQLTWSDNIRAFPALTANDEFLLRVRSTDGDTQEVSGTNESLLLGFRVDTLPATQQYQGRNVADIGTRVAKDFAPAHEGKGAWDFSLTLLEAGDFIDTTNDVFDLDNSNNYEGDVIITHYTMHIVEIG